MRKLIVLAAFVCAVMTTQAAALAWSLTGIEASDNTALANGAMIAYFMDGSTYDSFISSSDKGAYAAANGLSSATIQVGRNGAGATATFGSYAYGDPDVSGYIVLFDAATAASADYYANTEVMSLPVPSSGNIQFQTAFGTHTDGWQSMTTGGGGGDVPEPTSGLLLLVGGALLALRRKQK